MAARQIIVPGAMPARDANGHALPSKLRFYVPGSGGATPKSVFTSSALDVAHSFPILSDSAGRFPQIWADEDEVFDVAWSDQVYDAQIAVYADIQPLSDAVLTSAGLADEAASAAQDAQAAAEAAAASADAIADTLDLASLDPISVPYVTEAETTSFLATQQIVATFGYDSYDPRAAAMWKRAAGEPAHPGWFRSADRYLPDGSTSASDGGYWELSVREASVLTFGAKGDDVADDAAALQRALDYGIETGVPVHIDEGTYRFETPLSLDFTAYVNRPFTLRGAGWGWDTPGGMLTAGRGSILRYDGDPSQHAWTMDNGQYVTTSQNGRVVLADFALVGAGGSSSGGDGFNCTVINNTIFDNLFVGYFPGVGMTMTRCYGSEIREGLIANNFKGGVDYVDAGNAVRLFRTRVFGNGADFTTQENFGLRFRGDMGGGPSNAPIIDQCDLSYNGAVGYRASDDSLTQIVVAAGVATVTTAADHGRTTGDYIAVNGAATNALNTDFAKQITVTGARTFTYPAAEAPAGTYDKTSDADLRIGTGCNCLFLTAVYGVQVSGLTIETPNSGMAAYVGPGAESYSFSGGFILSGRIVLDSNAGEGQVDNIVLQGQEAILRAYEGSARAKIDLGRGITLVSGASITHSDVYRLEGQWFGAEMPSSGTWEVGDFVSNTAPVPEEGRIVRGWLRLTDGAGHLPDTDWAAISVLNGEGQTLQLVNGSRLDDVADGAVRIATSDGAGTTRLHFGPASSSFPMLKRSGVTLHLRTGDDASASYLYLGGLAIDGFGAIQPQGDGVLQISDVNGGAVKHMKFGPNSSTTPGLRIINNSLRISSTDQTTWLGLEAKFVNINDFARISDGGLSGYAAITRPDGTALSGLALGPFTSGTPMLSASGNDLYVQLADSSAATGVVASKFSFVVGGGVASNTDGIFTLYASTSTGVIALCFGGDGAGSPALWKSGAGLELRLADNSDAAPLTTKTVRTSPLVVSSLPSAAAAGAGTRAFVSDSITSEWWAMVVGGGSDKVPIVSDGTSWRVG